jgi:hypothetical protein
MPATDHQPQTSSRQPPKDLRPGPLGGKLVVRQRVGGCRLPPNQSFGVSLGVLLT